MCLCNKFLLFKEVFDFGKETDYSVVIKDEPTEYPLGDWKVYLTLNNLPPDPKTMCLAMKFELTEY